MRTEFAIRFSEATNWLSDATIRHKFVVGQKLDTAVPMSRSDILFNSADWFSIVQNQQAILAKEIRDYDGDRLLNTSVGDLCVYFEDKYRIDVPVLLDGQISVEQNEVNIDVSQDPTRMFTRPGPHYAKGTQISVVIPFEGDGQAFQIQPSRYGLDPPRGTVTGQALTLEFEALKFDPKELRVQIDGEIAKIKRHLDQLRTDVGEFNRKLGQSVRHSIETRRGKLLADRSLVAELGFPLKQRANAPATYAAPEVKRRITPVPPHAGTGSFKPEPTLTSADYEHILNVIQNMAEVMERSPSAFASMDEEALRSHFLVQLNGHYEGQATGETFNYEGKTDILVRVNGRNIFIGECKYWGGAKTLTDTIDQILSYSSWRDTKVAIIIFSQLKNFSNVLKEIPPTMEKHPNFKRALGMKSETQFSYLFSHRDDPSREMTMAVLAFDVPIADK